MINQLFCPAKVNLFLQIHGRREDGYHDLTSLMAPLDFGDSLEFRESRKKEDFLEIRGLPLEVTSDNLILQATRRFREVFPSLPPIAWSLYKRIPWGAGLGGGSSDAASALLLLQGYTGNGLTENQLWDIAVNLGADVPFFLKQTAGWVSGIGERWSPLDEDEKKRMAAQKLLLFSPGFSVSTVWVYQQLARRFTMLYGDPRGDTCLNIWKTQRRWSGFLYNSLEPVVSSKYLAIPALLGRLRTDLAVDCQMSGSGSSCFALIHEDTDPGAIEQKIRECWGVAAREVRLDIALNGGFQKYE